MNAKYGTAPRTFASALLTTLVLTLPLIPQAARADIYGRLQIQIKVSMQPGEPPAALSGVQLTLRDTSGVNGDITVRTGRDLSVLTPPLLDTGWELVRVAGIVAPPQNAPTPPAPPRLVPFALSKPVDLAVTSDAITNVTVGLNVAEGRVTRVNDFSLASQTGNAYERDSKFIKKIPATGTNSQSLNRVLRTVP